MRLSARIPRASGAFRTEAGREKSPGAHHRRLCISRNQCRHDDGNGHIPGRWESRSHVSRHVFTRDTQRFFVRMPRHSSKSVKHAFQHPLPPPPPARMSRICNNPRRGRLAKREAWVADASMASADECVDRATSGAASTVRMADRANVAKTAADKTTLNITITISVVSLPEERAAWG